MGRGLLRRSRARPLREDYMPDDAKRRAYATREPCWKCGRVLLRLDPECDGWRFWCPNCGHLTAPAGELESQLASVTPGAVGIVAAASANLIVLPPDCDESDDSAPQAACNSKTRKQ